MNTLSRTLTGLRRVAILGDTHGALAAGLTGLLGPADLIIHTGDVGSAAVLEQLGKVAPVIAVKGNNDTPAKWPLAHHACLSALPDVQELKLDAGLLVVVHGHQWPRAGNRHAALRKRWPHARLVVYGHSHRQAADNTTHPQIANPGAAGHARTYGGASFIWLHADVTGWRCETVRLRS